MTGKGTIIEVDSCNADKLSKVYKSLLGNYEYYKDKIYEYPLEVEFCGYRFVLYKERDLPDLVNNLGKKLEEHYKFETTKWNGHGI